jgi:hypothetical protein
MDEMVNKNNLDEHDALWEAIARIEDAQAKQRKEIEELSKGDGNHAETADIKIPR